MTSETIRKSVLPVAAGIAFIGAVGTFTSNSVQGALPSPPQNVLVQNPATQPVPTIATGTTAVNGTVGVSGPVTVSGSIDVGSMPAVSLSPGALVNLGNSPTSPVPVQDVDNPANQPFSTAVRLEIGNGEIFEGQILSAPTGKTLVVEHVSGEMTIGGAAQSDLKPAVVALTMSQVGLPNSLYHTVLPTFLGTALLVGNEKEDSYSFSQPMRFYVEGGRTLSYQVAFENPVEKCFCVLSLSGYLVNRP